MKTTNQPTSKRVTIFEGCDNSGKTTVALRFAQETGARYVHFHNLPRVGLGLPRFYVEAMLPAVLGYQDVVLDRCWLSERPYGAVMRDGEDRMDDVNRRMCERLAMRCGAVVVYCRPPWETVKVNYLNRGEKVELLDDTRELGDVYEKYQDVRHDLPELIYDYTAQEFSDGFMTDIELIRMPCHPLNLATAGNWDARIILVGESFAAHRDGDAFYQWPFASFGLDGCSQWLTKQLHEAGINEAELCWVNADQDLSFLNGAEDILAIALGNVAMKALSKIGCSQMCVSHPQFHKRFHSHEQYELIDMIRTH